MSNDTIEIFKPIKLMFIVNVDWFFMSHRLPIALEALSKGCDVHLATTVTDKKEELEKLGITVHPLLIGESKGGIFQFISSFFEIISVLKKVRPNLVHLVTIKPVLLGGIATRLTKVEAVVAAISGLGSVFSARGFLASIRRRIIGGIYKEALKHKNLKVIFQNENDKAILKELTGLSKTQIHMIPGSGVNLDLFNSEAIADDEMKFIFAGRLLYEKGIGEFIQAAQSILAEATAKKQKVKFILVGAPYPNNPSSVKLEEIKEWEKSGIIEYWGVRKDMPEVLRQAYAVVLPSYYGEGLPKILIEAAASGRAVITTDHPGCRDAIINNVTGLLVKTRDAIDLANAMRRLIDSPEQTKQMGLSGRKIAEQKFAIESVTNEHLKIYTELLSKNFDCEE
jgi:glycosyltransferase involved in cell wall biosynthesis